MNDKVYLAIDLGAGSGRLLAGQFDLQNLGSGSSLAPSLDFEVVKLDLPIPQ